MEDNAEYTRQGGRGGENNNDGINATLTTKAPCLSSFKIRSDEEEGHNELSQSCRTGLS